MAVGALAELKRLNREGAKDAKNMDQKKREMLRRQQADQARTKIDARLTRAIARGPSTPLTRRDWKNIRAEGIKCARRHEKK